jgi:hypothetical protein
MDTAIAIRTMVFKDGIVYFQAGGGIVYDSVEEDEYIETINKLSANVKAIDEAESMFYLLHEYEYLTQQTKQSFITPSNGLRSKRVDNE